MDSDLDIEDICCFELDGLNFKEMLKRKKESTGNGKFWNLTWTLVP